MSSHTVDDLVGRTFYASIGEPWDFESDAGSNKLLGTIQQIALDQSGNPFLLCEVDPFSFSKSKIHQVVAVNRHRGSQDVIDALRTKGSATLNFMFQKSGEALPEIGMNAALSAFSHTANCSFLVGTMHLQQRSQTPSADPEAGLRAKACIESRDEGLTRDTEHGGVKSSVLQSLTKGIEDRGVYNVDN